MNPSLRARRDATLVFLLLVLIVVLAAGLRFYQIGAQSLWSDEGNSAALAARSLIQITRDAANDIHPPLYYWLLSLWTRIFGTSEAALRSLSGVLGILLVLCIAQLGRCMHNKAVGLVAAFFAAISPFQVYYSQEARMYILLALEAAAAVLFFWRLLAHEEQENPLSAENAPAEGVPSTKRPRWLGLSALALVLVWVAGLYTHYAFPLMIALLTALYLVWVFATHRRGRVLARLLHWGLLLILTLVAYLPWLSTAARQITTWPGAASLAELGEAAQNLASTLLLGPAALGWVRGWWAGLLLGLAVLGSLPWAAAVLRSGPRSRALRLLAWITPVAWLLAPIAMILVLQLFREAYLKFLLIASPALVLLQARGVLAPAGWLSSRPTGPHVPDAAPQRFPVRGALGIVWACLALVLVGVTSGMTLIRYYNDPTVARDDYRGIAKFIGATARPGDAVLLHAPGQSEVFQYYYKGDLPVYALPRQRPIDAAATEQDLQALLEHDKVYAVYWATGEADPDGLIQKWLDSRGYKTLDQWRGKVRLAVYVMPEHRAPDETSGELNLRVGDDITLLDYKGWNLAPTAGEVTQLQLEWRAEKAPEGRYKVFVQLLDGNDQVVAQHDAEPQGGSRPTDSWKPGEIVQDNLGLLIPPGTPPGSYRRILGMYDVQTLERQRLPDGSDHVDLPPITVARSKTAPPLEALSITHGKRFDFGAISLLGHDLYKRGFGHQPDTPLRPGDPLHLTFYWQANNVPRADWWFDLVLSDNTGQTVASLHAPLVGEAYSTTLWSQDEVVRGEHDLTIPPDVPPGTYRLSLAVLPDIDTLAGTAYLGTVKVSPPEE
jgi:mannosyltransferase